MSNIGSPYFSPASYLAVLCIYTCMSCLLSLAVKNIVIQYELRKRPKYTRFWDIQLLPFILVKGGNLRRLPW